MNRPPSADPLHAAELPERFTALHTTTPSQRAVLWILALAVSAAAVGLGPILVLQYANRLVLVGYAVVLTHRLAAAVAGLMPDPAAQRRQALQPPPTQVPDPPLISVLIPLYREAEVLAQIAGAMSRMDYPQDRFEVLLLLEEDDVVTRTASEQTVLPRNVKVIIVPPGQPRTKPRACNFGLQRCTGDITVVFDAEDQPEPDQFKKAAAALAVEPPETICLQARLSYYNPGQNLLTRWFAGEYLTWFGTILPGLRKLGSPIPLGGTSNYFRTSALKQLGGWDPWNVTEDCDLGLRLYRRGYRVGMLQSTTWEEACSQTPIWLRQRSRWVKGYLQSGLVHSRDLPALFRELGTVQAFHFVVLVWGSVACLLVNPLYWLLSLLWIFHPTHVEHQLFSGPTGLLALSLGIIGNGLLILTHCSGALRLRQSRIAIAGLIVPLYWVLMSLAAWKALLQLLIAPHYWEKTRHGLAVGAASAALPEHAEQ